MKTLNGQTSGVSSAIETTIENCQSGQSLIIEAENAEDYTVKLAQSIEEREAVFRLAYQVYLQKGFIKSNANEWLIREYDFDKATAIIIVKNKKDQVVGALTMVFDGYSILPATLLYGDEISKLRNSGEKIVEISRLIIDAKYRNSKEILTLMINYLFIYVNRVQKYSYLVIEVNPRHKSYYQELLCFQEVGQEKPCPSVENAPANLLVLPISLYKKELARCHNQLEKIKKIRSLYQYFIKEEQESLVAYYLSKQFRHMTFDEMRYFGYYEKSELENVCL